MRDTIQKILKEEREFQQSLYVVMSDDEKWVSPYYKSGTNSNVFDSIQRLTLHPEDYFNPTLHSAEVSLSLLSDRALSTHKPKIVKYNVGYFRDDNVDDVFDKLNESDELEWAKEVIETPTDWPLLNQVYRINLPKKERAIIDVLITDIKGEVVWDDTRAIIFDPKNSSIRTVGGQREFLKDYNRSHDRSQMENVRRLIKGGHWIPIRTEDSLFKNDEFNPHTYQHPTSEEERNFKPYEDFINESEEDNFEWVDEPVDEPFHKTLMGDNPRKPMLMDEVTRILFNPPVRIGDSTFNSVAYWLEDYDYYPETLQLDGQTSYIQITKQRGTNRIRNGKWIVGPKLNDKELYELSQTPTIGDWNGNFWYEEFKSRFIDKPTGRPRPPVH